MRGFDYEFSREKADSYLRKNYSYGIDFFRSSFFIINGYWAGSHDTFGRKKMPLKRFLKQTIRRYENLKSKTLDSITTIEYHNSNYRDPFLRTQNKSQFEINKEWAINRYKLNPFFKEIDGEIMSCKKALDFIDNKIPATTPEQREIQNLYKYTEKKGRPIKLIYKVSSVWALLIRDKNTERVNWTDINHLLFWFNENKSKGYIVFNRESKGKIPDISSFEREFHRIKKHYGKEFLEQLKDKCINAWGGKLGEGIEIV